MGGSSSEQTVGYKYFLGAHLVYCQTTDSIREIIVGGKRAWFGVESTGPLTISEENLFGGESREGGITGIIDYEDGNPSQTVNAYLQSKIGGLLPAFRGVTALVLNQPYIGTNYYLKNWAARFSRIHTRENGQAQWYDEKAEIFEIKGAEAYYFAIDVSTSMDTIVFGSTTRLDVVKQGLVKALDLIKKFVLPTKPRVDIGLVAWSGTATFNHVYNVQDSDIAGIQSWINSRTTSASTDFTNAINDALVFFNQLNTDGVTNVTRNYYFITDGEPVPSASADDAAALAADMLDQNSGSFSIGSGTEINMYSINIDLADVSHSIKLDNTPQDNVQVIDGANVNELLAAIFLGAPSSMNPAHIIRECLTEPWGLKLPESKIDSASFTASADTLHDEDTGLSLLWDRQSPIEEFIELILRHIDGVLDVDPSTGKFTLKLIRDDYDPNTLLVLDESNTIEITNYKELSMAETVNSVSVVYRDAWTDEDASVTVQDIALAHRQGATVSTTMQYPGFVNRRVATLAAQRDLKALSGSLVSFTVIVNREAAVLRRGDVFKQTWSNPPINGLVMRVTDIAYGDGVNNRVKITCTQDAFATPNNVLLPDVDSEWESPNQYPQASPHSIAYELPYYEYVRQVGSQSTADSNLAATPEIGYAGVSAGRATPATINARFWVDDGGGYIDTGSLDFCACSVLNENITELQKTFEFTSASDIGIVSLNTWVQIDDEIMEVISIAGTSITVERGLLDTVPAKHSTGAAMMFWDGYTFGDSVEYVDGDTVNIKVTPITTLGQLSLDAATALPVTIAGRAARPYPPGNVKIDDVYFPTAQVVGNFEVKWSTRNRIFQTGGGSFVHFEDIDVTPEASTTYEIRVYDNDTETLLKTHTALTASPETITETGLETASNLRVELSSIRDALYSLFAQTMIFPYSPSVVPQYPQILAIITQAFGSDTTTHNVNMPSTVDANDMLIVKFVNDGSVRVITPSGWMRLGAVLIGARLHETWFAKIAAGTEGGTSVDFATTAAEQAASITIRVQQGTYHADIAPQIVFYPIDSLLAQSDINPTRLDLSVAAGLNKWIFGASSDDVPTITAYPEASDNTYITSGASGIESVMSAICTKEYDTQNYYDAGQFSLSGATPYKTTAAAIGIPPAIAVNPSPGAHVYWRLHITRNSTDATDYFVSITDIELLSSIDGVNIAYGGTITASSEFSSLRIPAYAFDGLLDSRWTSGNGSASPQWIQYQFAAAQEIIAYTIRESADSTVNDHAPRDWTLEYSDDGISWTVAHKVVDQYKWRLGEHRKYHLAGPVAADSARPLIKDIVTTEFATAATAHLVSMPASVDANDLLVVKFCNDASATVTTPAGWSYLSTLQYGVRSSWYYKIAAGTEGGTSVDFVTSVAEEALAIVVMIKQGTYHASISPQVLLNHTNSTTDDFYPPPIHQSWGASYSLYLLGVTLNDARDFTKFPTSDYNIKSLPGVELSSAMSAAYGISRTYSGFEFEKTGGWLGGITGSVAIAPPSATPLSVGTHVYWRLHVTRNSTDATDYYVNIAEIELKTSIESADEASGGTASSSETGAGSSPDNSFDNDDQTRWFTQIPPVLNWPHWIQYQLPSAKEIRAYTVQASNSQARADHAPRDWTLEYSDDGISWTVAHTVVDQYEWQTSEKRSYYF